MRKIRRQGTAAEVAVRKVSWAAGVRLAPPSRQLPGSPDLVNFRRHLAVFVHGCFWHGHRGCAHATVPKRNRSFWLAKFERNRERDREALRALRRLGFRVVTIWECQAEDSRKLVRRLRNPSREG